MRGLPHYRVDRKHGGSTDEPLSLNRYTYYANKALRYTDPSGHFFGAVLRFIGGAVIGGGIEFITQKFIEKREKVDWKAVLYEGVVGGVTAVIGGVGGTAGKVGKAEKTIKTVAKGALKTGEKEGIGGFVEDVGYQVFVEDKSLDEVDYGQAAKVGATAGVTAMVDKVLDVISPKKQVSTKNKKKTSQATGLVADSADDTPSPRVKADAVPESKVKGTVAGSTGGISSKMNLQFFAEGDVSGKVLNTGTTSKISTAKSNSSQGFSSKGYNPKQGERTFAGFVDSNVPKSAEVSLHTYASGFNTTPPGGEFKRFGTVPGRHGVSGSHVHLPERNIIPSTGEIKGGLFNNKKGIGVASPKREDIIQLYQYIFNEKYR